MLYVFKNILLLVFLNRSHIRYAFGAGAIAIQIVWTQPVILSFVLAATHLLKKTWFKMVKLKKAYRLQSPTQLHCKLNTCFLQESFKMELVNHLAVNEWGCVSYEELWRFEEGVIRRGRKPRRITFSEISIILQMIRKPNWIIVLLFIQNNS